MPNTKTKQPAQEPAVDTPQDENTQIPPAPEDAIEPGHVASPSYY